MLQLLDEWSTSKKLHFLYETPALRGFAQKSKLIFV
jgi:hypothetical protein